MISAAFRRIVLLALGLVTSPAFADIYEWECIDPFDPALGKQQSHLLAPDGGERVPAPGANLSNLDLTNGYLSGADLESANLSGTTLNDAYLAGANLHGASIRSVDFTNADLTGASFGVFSVALVSIYLRQRQGKVSIT